MKMFVKAALISLLLLPASTVTAKEITAPMHDTATASSHFNLNKAVQRALRERGHDPGPVDGLWGTRSADALKAFQASQGLRTTGRIDPTIVDSLVLTVDTDGTVHE